MSRAMSALRLVVEPSGRGFCGWVEGQNPVPVKLAWGVTEDLARANSEPSFRAIVIREVVTNGADPFFVGVGAVEFGWPVSVGSELGGLDGEQFRFGWVTHTRSRHQPAHAESMRAVGAVFSAVMA